MKKILMTGIVALGMIMTSCDDYLDINQDPNSPTVDNLNCDLIFPAAELAYANVYGNYLRTTGGYFSQIYSQNFGCSNYLDYSQFYQYATKSSGAYTDLCVSCLGNMNTSNNIARSKGAWGSYLAGTVIKAAAFQAMVDCYGEIPYSEALSGNAAPKYDDGVDVYKGLVAELDEALSKANVADLVCTNYLYSGQTAGAWIQAANALKLRLLMRMSKAVDVKDQLAKLIAENNFPITDVKWSGFYANSVGQASPFWAEEFSSFSGAKNQADVILNVALSNTMNDYEDARLEAYFNPNGEGKFFGGVSGTKWPGNYFGAGDFCRPNVDYDSPVYFITKSEIEFFLAEYEARYGSMATAESHYKAAVVASFESNGLTADQADAALAAYPWSASNYMKVIGIQKWIALAGTNPFEAYCELRRIGYPAMGNVKGDQIYSELTGTYDASVLPAGELYTPIQVNAAVGAGKIVERWPYPSGSSNVNNNVPKFKGYTTPIFWAE